MSKPVFRPRLFLRSPHLQTVLASTAPRRPLVRWRSRSLERSSRSWVLDCNDGVRLQGLHSPADPARDCRGLVVLLHGWEGSARSTYMLSLASRLLAQGYEVFRLNFRDHGETHHLNEELFHSCRLPEVVGAVRAIADRSRARPLLLVGFSLGGNFALRVARRAREHGIVLDRVVAVCPPIEPSNVLAAMEGGWRVYENYFVRKWRRSLRIKQRVFPQLYDFAEWERLRGLRDTTRYLIERYTEFESLEQYLAGYSIAGMRLAGLDVPATIVSAADDPVTPSSDLGSLVRVGRLEVELHPGGGHCGFLHRATLDSWIDDRIVALLDRGGASEKVDAPAPGAAAPR